MAAWLKNNVSTVCWWIGLIAGSAIVLVITRGSQFQQLGIGLLISAISLFVIMALFEALWYLADRQFNFQNNDSAPGRPPGSRPGRR
jgi:hypothetical protein